MDYWDAILDEVLHKKAGDVSSFKFTDIGRSLLRDRTRKQRNAKRYQKKSQQAQSTYFLGDSYEGVYFTQREAECVYHMLQGKSIPQTARDLGLSPRTIEFYVKNMRLKVGAPNKKALIEKIRKTALASKLMFDDEGL